MLDASAAAIIAQTAQIVVNTEQIRGNLTPFEPGTLTSIDASLARIGDALWVLADISSDISSTLQDIEIDLSAQVVQQSESNGYQAKMLLVQKDAADFQRAVTEQALDSAGIIPPKLPPISKRFKELVKDTQEMMSISKAEGFVNQMLTDSLKNITAYAQGTAVYKTVEAKIQLFIKSNFPRPASIANRTSKAASLLGSKATDLGVNF